MAFNALIIDDDAAFKMLLERRLKSFIPDLNVTYFNKLAPARDFLKQSKELPFDIVFLDEHLPDGRGLDFLNEGLFQDLAILSVSSDTAPEIPGKAVSAGASFFLSKMSVSEPLFRPLVEGIIDRNKIQKELQRIKMDSLMVDTVRTLVGTLRHEINNPLGAVLGAAYLLRNNATASADQKEAAELVESSGKRIKYVLDELCKAVAIESVTKAHQKVFHIPGDKPWDDSKK
jgi:response regulator of citrate/malate metabolism